MKTKLTLIALLAGVSISTAATVQIARSGAGTGFNVLRADGTTNLNAGGYYIAVGNWNFGNDPVPTITDAASLLSAVNAFTIFGSTTAPISGTTIGLIIGSITATDTNFNSDPLYILVGNAATKAGSTEFAILQGTPANFQFAANVGVAGSTTYTVATLAQIAPISGAGTELNTPGSTTGSTYGATIQLASTVAIPEPSAAALGLLAGLGMIARRRRD